jgi:hypothetical protein
MGATVLPPDAVAVAIGYLTEVFDDVGEDAPVVPRVPADRPDRFVRIIRTGGPMKNLVQDAPQLTVECWGLKDEDAADLASLSRALLKAAQGQVWDGVAIGAVHEFSGPALLPDPLSNQPRYTFTMQMAMRGQPLEEVLGS